MKYPRGDVVLCRVPMPSVGLLEHKLRPGLIVSKSSNNERLDDVMIAIITTNTSRSEEPTQYLIEGNEIQQAGIRIPSVVRCDSLLTISKTMIVKSLGSLSESGLKKVNSCLINALEISL